jgi:hypothetical protein
VAIGELTWKDVTFLNVAAVNLQPGNVVILDVANSGGGPAVTLPGAALAEPLGVCVEKTKLSALDQSVVAGQGMDVRIWGIAYTVSAGAIAIGDHLSVANTQGQVQTQARAGAGTQPVPIVGRALTAASGAGQGVMTLLMIGATY